MITLYIFNTHQLVFLVSGINLYLYPFCGQKRTCFVFPCPISPMLTASGILVTDINQKYFQMVIRLSKIYTFLTSELFLTSPILPYVYRLHDGDDSWNFSERNCRRFVENVLILSSHLNVNLQQWSTGEFAQHLYV